jgi:serine/threonine protein kinase
MSFGNSPLLDNKAIIYDDSSTETRFGYLIKKGEYRGKKVLVKSLLGINQQVDKLALAEALLIEAKKLWGLDHSCLVKFVGVVVDLNSVVYEAFSDTTLSHFIRETPKMTWADKLLVTADIACGMHYLHTEIVVQKMVKKAEFLHQDLSSSNIILVFEKDRRMRAKISDYGLAGVRNRIKNVKDSALKSSVLKSDTGKDNTHIAPEIVFQNAKVSFGFIFSLI